MKFRYNLLSLLIDLYRALLVGIALSRARQLLPEGYEVWVSFEGGVYMVRVYDTTGNRRAMLPADDTTLAMLVDEAVDACMREHAVVTKGTAL